MSGIFERNLTREQLADLIFLCSAIVHLQERLDDGGHPADTQAAEGLLALPNIRRLFQDLDRASLLPVRRDGRRPWFTE